MASIAFDSSGSREASRSAISLHPAFPAVVALWFAALLGLGSIVLPVVLIERVVEISGLAALVPAASPPLGFMARGLVALASAVAGAAIGVAIARRVARSHDAGRPSRVPKFARGARRPIDVNEELGGEGVVNGFGLPISRRRALAIAEDDRPSDFLYMAPLPGHDEDAPGLAFDERSIARPIADEPFELSDAFEDSAEVEEPETWDTPEAADTDAIPPMTFAQDFQAPPPEPRTEPRQEFRPAPSRSAAQPLPFSAPSQARRAQHAEALLAEPEPLSLGAGLDGSELHSPVRAEAATAAPEPLPFRGDWSSAPLPELGLVQLVQRLGASLERRREWLAGAASASPARMPVPASFDPAPAGEAAQAMAAYFGKPCGDAEGGDEARDEVPPALRAPAGPRPNPPGSWPAADDEDDFDPVASFTLPLRKPVAPTIAFDEPAGPENDDDIEDGGVGEPDGSYSSLLAIRNPFAPKDNGFVRVEEPEADHGAVEPAVVFPGHREAASAPATLGQAPSRTFDPPAGADSPERPNKAPADTDAALRAALATLQRMSGTA